MYLSVQGQFCVTIQKILIYNFPVLMLLAKGFLPLDAIFTRFCAIDVSLALFLLSNWHILKVGSKAASYPGTLKFMYNYKGTPLHACYFVY